MKKKPHLVVLSSTTSSFWHFRAIFCLIPISSCRRYPQIRFGYPGSPLDFIHILLCFFPPSFYHHEHLHFGLMLSDTFRPQSYTIYTHNKDRVSKNTSNEICFLMVDKCQHDFFPDTQSIRKVLIVKSVSREGFKFGLRNSLNKFLSL